jgi:hypothetical protein
MRIVKTLIGCWGAISFVACLGTLLPSHTPLDNHLLATMRGGTPCHIYYADSQCPRSGLVDCNQEGCVLEGGIPVCPAGTTYTTAYNQNYQTQCWTGGYGYWNCDPYVHVCETTLKCETCEPKPDPQDPTKIIVVCRATAVAGPGGPNPAAKVLSNLGCYDWARK